MRDEFPLPTKEIMAKRVAYHCSNPSCRHVTSGPQSDPQKAVNIGVAAHISAASEGGPRYDPTLTEEDRGGIENGIWLCQSCAKLVDNDPVRYPKEVLKNWKKGAEQEAARSLEHRRASGSHEEVAFRKAERLLPKLLEEMRADLSRHPLVREFVVLKKTWLFNWPPDQRMFAYYYEDHEDLENQFQVLENLHLISLITRDNVLRYLITEEFADYLVS